MADDIVGGSEQLALRVAGNTHEDVIHVSEPTFKVGLADDDGIRVEGLFGPGEGGPVSLRGLHGNDRSTN